ncbi:BspA family leucine-rich repeat surface protein [Campylobacter sp.]|uniref:BspA family leucine-rich repeat surface protein n=1 Tax=Campylobacter sp. TaxID=205 RepID=UPI002AA82285|nr:BspA family leucine-rich repeat surface protein [Campylobacter sp.]MCI7076810.1 BspA family leucine-rich repeat surface protein [Campylobacter sp.]
MAKYAPKTRVELQELIKNESINLGDIDVSGITDMSNLFYEDEDCNEIKRKDFSGIESWDVSNVTDMSYMFNGCEEFNRPLNNWEVSAVTNMTYMFSGCSKFDQPLDKWNVSSVVDMGSMFSGCSALNQSFEDWMVSDKANLDYMFDECEAMTMPSWCYSLASNNDYDDDDSGDYEVNTKDGVMIIQRASEEFKFSQNGDDIEFEIPQKALKFLCFLFQISCDLGGLDNEKEFYSNGKLKTIRFFDSYSKAEEYNEERFSKYEFNENRELTSFDAVFKAPDDDIYYQAAIKNIEYFSKNDRKFAKGIICGKELEEMEGLATVLAQEDFARIYAKNIDTKLITRGKLTIDDVPTSIRGIGNFSLDFNEYGILSYASGYEPFRVSYDEDGLPENVYLSAYAGGGEVLFNSSITRKFDEEKEGYIKISMFNDDFSGEMLDNLMTDLDENGDMKSQGAVIVDRTYYSAFYDETHKKESDKVIFAFDVMNIKEGYDIEAEDVVNYDAFDEWDGEDKEWFLNDEIGQECYFIKTTDFYVKKGYLSRILKFLLEANVENEEILFVKQPLVMF